MLHFRRRNGKRVKGGTVKSKKEEREIVKDGTGKVRMRKGIKK